MSVERFPYLVEVLGAQLLRVVELVAVDELAETFHGSPHALGCRFARPLRLVAAGHEARDHGSERPDSE